jgi:hypothetical protein
MDFLNSYFIYINLFSFRNSFTGLYNDSTSVNVAMLKHVRPKENI